jgi:uncharacterized protein YbjT (DUF2867 family)
VKVLVTGSGGYIGSRLVPRLLAAGHEVRCLVRRPAALDAVPWRGDVEVVQGDLQDAASVRPALDGCDAAFYLVHSMGGPGGDFDRLDREMAQTFRQAAAEARLRRIVYLGGLGRGAGLSRHLASRQEVGEILRAGATPVTELRAAVIIGSGSMSFEMLRYLTEVLPAMVTPRWVRSRCQPIAIGDVLTLLVAALEEDGDRDVVHEIGGPDQLTYEQMMRVYAEVAGLRRRWIVPVPVLSPRLSSHWVGLVTPLPARTAKPLVESLRVEVTVADNTWAQRHGPLTGYREAVVAAVGGGDGVCTPPSWDEAAADPARTSPGDPVWAGGTVRRDERVVHSAASPERLLAACADVAGRGLLSLMRWQTAHVEPGRTLSLRAGRRLLPGQAWLSFDVQAAGQATRLRQTAVFVPRGLAGRVYWWLLLPVHRVVFRWTARRIVAAANRG